LFFFVKKGKVSCFKFEFNKSGLIRVMADEFIS